VRGRNKNHFGFYPAGATDWSAHRGVRKQNCECATLPFAHWKATIKNGDVYWDERGRQVSFSEGYEEQLQNRAASLRRLSMKRSSARFEALEVHEPAEDSPDAKRLKELWDLVITYEEGPF
jgi:hypothetical protein